ncbi:MAG: VOC family protein [Natronomonas sp.]
MQATAIDHLVLYVEDIEATTEFYDDRLGVAETVTFDDGRTALVVGEQKINLHPAGDEYVPHADAPTAGAGDFCLCVDSLETIRERLETADVPIVHGPVEKVGARGPMLSVYVRDPDGNLVEFADYDADRKTK